MTLFAIIHRHA